MRLQPKCRWLRQGEPCPGGRGPRQARHGWRAPDSGQDVLRREKRLPAVRARRPTGARTFGLVHPHAQNQTSALRAGVRHSPAEQSNNQMTERIPLLIDTDPGVRSEEHTSELQSLMRISYAVFCLQKKKH